jgi:hypothetical protein
VDAVSADRETAATIMQQTYGHRGLASMALDQSDRIAALERELRYAIDALEGKPWTGWNTDTARDVLGTQ